MTFFRAVLTVIIFDFISILVMMSCGDMIATTLSPMAIDATFSTNLYGIPQTIVLFFGFFMVVLFLFMNVVYIPAYMIKRENDVWRQQ